MTVEWMPDYPCDMGCVGCIGMPNPKCHAIILYNGQIDAQRELLEYLIFVRDYDYYIDNAGLITIASLIEMLEQIGRKNEIQKETSCN